MWLDMWSIVDRYLAKWRYRPKKEIVIIKKATVSLRGRGLSRSPLTQKCYLVTRLVRALSSVAICDVHDW